MDFLQGLNPQQREAAAHVEGPLLILAGAGSGKTRVITHRMGHLIRSHEIAPSSIMAVTFTNKAAEEMRNRVGKILGETNPNRVPRVSTFHSFSVRMLRRDGSKLADIRPGFTRTFNIYDADDQLSLVKSIFKAIGLDEEFMKYRAALSRISHAKNAQESPQDFYKYAGDQKMQRLAVVYEQYESRLRQANALDFDDLLNEAVRLLRHDEDLRGNYNRMIRHLMIDEYQDTNRSQYEMMRLLSSEHQNVVVVGDEDQSIYGWRGADIRNILDFENDYPGSKVIRLEQNYRSTQNILEAATAVVENNTQRKGKRLWTDEGEGDKIIIYEAIDGENEALYIANAIEKILFEHSKWKVAILYRTNAQSRQIEEALRRYNRKYVVVGGTSFYQRAEVKDILSYLKASVTPDDTVSVSRIVNTPARGIGKSTMELVEKYSQEHGISVWKAMREMVEKRLLGPRAEASLGTFAKLLEELHQLAQTAPVDRLLATIIERSGYMRMLEADRTPESEARKENLNELLNAAAEATEREETVADFLDNAALVADSDGIDEAAQVSLLTMHNAKGLEFSAVFIAGLEDGLFPHSRSLEDDMQMEEERRLCYVGLTRAEKKLTLSWAQSRRKFGGGPSEETIPSRFLTELPPNLVTHMGAGASRNYSGIDLTLETHEVRQSAKKNVFTGKTYNSLDNINQFFTERGITPKQWPPSQPPSQARSSAPVAPVAPQTARAIPQPIPRAPEAMAPPVPRQQSMFGDLELPQRPVAAKTVPARAPLAKSENQRPPWEAPNLPNSTAMSYRPGVSPAQGRPQWQAPNLPNATPASPRPAAASPGAGSSTPSSNRPPWEAPNLPNAPQVSRPVAASPNRPPWEAPKPPTVPAPLSKPPVAPASNLGSAQYAARQSASPKKSSIVGKSIRHAKYGSGVVLRQEGEGEDAKLTVSFPGFGLKKLVAKFAGIKIE